MTYNVFGGKLSLTQSINLLITNWKSYRLSIGTKIGDLE